MQCSTNIMQGESSSLGGAGGVKIRVPGSENIELPLEAYTMQCSTSKNSLHIG